MSHSGDGGTVEFQALASVSKNPAGYRSLGGGRQSEWGDVLLLFFVRWFGVTLPMGIIIILEVLFLLANTADRESHVY